MLQIAGNAVNAKLIGASRETKLKVSGLLSYEVEGADRDSRFKSGQWDGRSSFFDFRSEIFPAGFIQMLGRELKRDGHQVQFAYPALPAPLGPEIGTFDPFGYGFTDRYDYQPDTVRRLLKYGRIVARVATGGGKSNIAGLVVSTIARPALFLTTRKSLMWQMKRGFEQAGMTPGVIGDGHWAPRRGITVGMVQTLASRIADPDPNSSLDKQERQRKMQEVTLAYLGLVEVLIGEEAHEVGGFDYWDVTRRMKKALYRVALTATPFMRADGEANMRLQGAFGSIGIEVSEEMLINRGILATPYFKFLKTSAPALCRRSTKWPACYDLNIVENRERLKSAVQEVLRASQHGLTSMILIQRKKHGEIFETALREVGLRVEFIFGAHEQTEREASLARLGRKEIDVLIGTSILDVGVDVPSVGLVVTAGGGKAEVNHRQRIGRGLREKKVGPNVAFMLDFCDEGNKITGEHALQRRAIIDATPGFAERVLRPGIDFPYHLFSAKG